MVLSSGVLLASVHDALLASVCDVTANESVLWPLLWEINTAVVQLPGDGSHDGNSTSFCRMDIKQTAYLTT